MITFVEYQQTQGPNLNVGKYQNTKKIIRRDGKKKNTLRNASHLSFVGKRTKCSQHLSKCWQDVIKIGKCCQAKTS